MNELMDAVFFSIAPVTRAYIISVVGVFVLIKANVVHISSLVFDASAILDGEVWRLVTSFLVLSENFDLYFIFNVLFTMQVSDALEQTCRNWLHYLWMIFLGGFAIICCSLFVYFVGYVPAQLPLLYSSLKFFLVYVWSKRNRDQNVGMMLFVVVKLVYFPWILLLLDTLLFHDGMDDIYGIVFGHIFYWFEDVFPMYYNWRPLELPKFVNNIFFQQVELNDEPVEMVEEHID
ncbi:derlin-2.1, putative [Entamoeba invadens IP1]|uniref:Derlin n=1 Tax=Entamoeba invadens IP1 TaxID=370355 RepID=A0A0A1U9R6_ENTIV|nr:derlin-2.1, putative [Entamoeba invadens IP1]ELP91669.1 derlin-2.1, putative [Entamoeba invadens IP1]|eukprot:XP_004258440.1 derlin-2.1, putative [Entamoeba invadens IP1]